MLPRPSVLPNPIARQRVQALAMRHDVLQALHQVMRACTQALSDEVRALPWSARHKQMPVARAITRFLKFVDLDLVALLDERIDRFVDLPALVIYESELAGRGADRAEEMYQQWEPVLLCAMMEYTRADMWDSHQGVTYEFTGPLLDLMMETDIDTDVPVHLVRPPFPVISIRPVPGRSFQDTHISLLSDFPVEEVIVSRLPSDDDPELEILGFEILWPALRKDGRPVGGLCFFTEVFIRVRYDEQTPIGEKLLEALAGPSREKGEHPDEWLEFVAFLLKLLLYISVPSARLERRLERSELLHRAECEKNPKRKERLETEARRAYDRIVIGPISHADDEAGGHGGIGDHREVRPHWRRGFFKRQRFGAGRALSKVVFISPVLVRADRIGQDAPAPKDYLVKATATPQTIPGPGDAETR